MHVYAIGRNGDLVALSGFAMRFMPGIYGILDANDAGKSTMMNLITDNIRRDEVRSCMEIGVLYP